MWPKPSTYRASPHIKSKRKAVFAGWFLQCGAQPQKKENGGIRSAGIGTAEVLPRCEGSTELGSAAKGKIQLSFKEWFR